MSRGVTRCFVRTLLAAASAAIPSAAFAQAVAVKYADLRPNESVRVDSDDPRLDRREAALILRAGMDTLLVQRRLMTGSWPVPLHGVKGLQVQRGSKASHRGAVLGTVIGIPVGGLLGAVGGVVVQGLKPDRKPFLLGAVAGGALGFKIGYGPRSRWVPVILPALGGR